MRLVIISSLLCLVIVASAQSVLPGFSTDQFDESLVEAGLKNNPEEFTLITKSYDKGLSKLVPDELSTRILLNNNKPSQIEFYLEEEKFLTQIFDQFGRIVKEERIDHVIPFVNYSYDDEKLIATKINQRKNRSIHSQLIYKYDNALLLVSKEEYKGNDQLIRYWQYDYTNKGDLERELYFDLKNQSESKQKANSETRYVNHYSPNGELEKVEKQNNSKVEQRTTYGYYPDSTTMRSINYEQGGIPSEYHYELTSDSLKVSINGFFERGDTTKLRSRFREIYVLGDLIEYESRTMNGTYVKRYSTFYDYDEMGNWVKKITYSNGVPLTEEIRKFVY